jgi:hypothetical protein
MMHVPEIISTRMHLENKVTIQLVHSMEHVLRSRILEEIEI